MEKVLTIAGSDSLAGGGLQADLRTFEELEVFGLSVVTSIASIQPETVEISWLTPVVIRQQLQSILTQTKLRYLKTGLMDSAALQVVCDELAPRTCQLVVDPVLVFKEGQTELQTDYLTLLRQKLLPLAYLTTPNLTEASQISGVEITTKADCELAAQKIQALGCPNVVIKGGARLAGSGASDLLLSGTKFTWLEGPRSSKTTTDGAGCTFSAAITARLASGSTLLEAVQYAKAFVYQGIEHGVVINDHFGDVWARKLTQN